MTTVLGIDVGSNSVGSAWVDLERHSIAVGVSIFPAGVEEKDEGRGEPKNQERRRKRSLRRSLARRSSRKRLLRMFLIERGLFPATGAERNALLTTDVWSLRRRGLSEPLAPHEFGRVLLHLCQRRGALGLKMPEPSDTGEMADELGAKKKKSKKVEQDDEGKVKAAVEKTRGSLIELKARTFGEMMAMLMEERRQVVADPSGQPKRNQKGEIVTFCNRIRNELGNFEFHADRAMLRDEFEQLWIAQRGFNSELASKLTDEVKKALDDPSRDEIWRHKGLLFGQRNTYWNIGALGRCVLEPTDQCVPIADRHASYYRVLETVNNVRIKGPDDNEFHPLTAAQREQVIQKLRTQKTGTIAAIREAIGIDPRSLKRRNLPKEAYHLNIERDAERELNTDWFHREIVIAGIGAEQWQNLDESKREGLNRALLRFDPTIDEDIGRVHQILIHMGLDGDTAARTVSSWKTRPKIEKRLKMSRRAVRNLIPYMERQNDRGIWITQIEARIQFSSDPAAIDITTQEPITALQRKRYQMGASGINKRDRYYLKKHPELGLPPAPMLTNPVVRKAIHEVRRHVIAHIRSQGKKPDRIVIEFARETTKSAKQNDEILNRNRHREKIRRSIREEVLAQWYSPNELASLSTNQLRAAEDRIILLRQQRCKCAYSGEPITERQAATNLNVEIDHVVPYSRSGDNSLNNRVLCLRAANRNKGNQTPREWWGEAFDEQITPMGFMEKRDAATKGDYFTPRDYARKWRNLSCRDVPAEWKGSQLSDTAYAAKEVETYLQQSLWPDENTHLAAESTRRVFVTKGAYTAQLRREWQLYQRSFGEADPRDEIERASLKDRGDHREHAIDAVVIACTDSARLQVLSQLNKQHQEAWVRAKMTGDKPAVRRRVALETPWGSVPSFRRQVLSLIYDEFDDRDEDKARAPESRRALVVSHRSVGRKLSGALHEETLFGGLADPRLFTGSVSILGLNVNHLRLPVPESTKDAIARHQQRFLDLGIEKDAKSAKKRARDFVASKEYSPKLVDPPPGKSGLVRDIGMRKQLRRAIEARLKEAGFDSDADSFTDKELKAILHPLNPVKNKPEFKPLTMDSGVPIKRVVVLRTMDDPVIVRRKAWDEESGTWNTEQTRRSIRAYVGGNNHHLEIRENKKGEWDGKVIPTYEAARRARIHKLDPVDRSDDPQDGARFVMSLAEGETVYMRHKDPDKPADYFVVFKLNKPNMVEFKYHWDARRATGIKDDRGEVVPKSKRESMQVSAAQLRKLAPPGELTPIKVMVDPLGRVHRVEPLTPQQKELGDLDPKVIEIAREALTARSSRAADLDQPRRRRRHGSWSWMHARLKREKLEHLAAQLSIALRLLGDLS